MNPLDIQAEFYDLSSGLAERIGRDIGSYSVALLAVFGSGPNEELRFCGSGSLVSVADTAYIMTAFHVWEKFEGAKGIGLTLDQEGVDHRFFIDMKLIVSIGPKQISNWNAPRGPDMRLLTVPLKHVDQLKRAKRFYPLTVDIPEPPNVDSLEFWMLMGFPGEQSEKLPKHVSLTMNAILAKIRSRDTCDGLDYVDLDMDVIFPGIPKTFNGVSGGGLWSVFAYGADDGEVHWTLNLVGMACWQLPGLVNTNGTVRCLGTTSIRSLIAEVAQAGTSTNEGKCK